MTANEVRLLKILLTLCLVIGLILLFSAGVSILSEQNEKLRYYEKSITESQKATKELKSLKAFNILEKDRQPIPANNESKEDLASFVASIKSSLLRCSIVPDKYSVSGSNTKSVYFSFHATPHHFFSFLENASNKTSNFAIYYINMQKLENDSDYQIEIKARYEK